MIISEERYLSHHGVKGQKWGVRRMEKRHAKFQKKVLDPTIRVAEGRGALKDKLRVAMLVPLHQVIRGNLQSEAQKNLGRGLEAQRKMNTGETSVRGILARAGGYDMRRLNYSYNKPA